MSSRVTFPTEAEVQTEADKLFNVFKGKVPEITREACLVYAPLIAQIKQLKIEKKATILAHTYVQLPVLYGVADFVGDSLFLSKKAMETTADVIVFAGVRFMAETAKILNPTKTVLLPAPDAGCSLADGVTAEDVRNLKKAHPGAWVVCYVNTPAEVKAEADVCCTSANALEIVNAVPTQEVIFVPDRMMAENLGPLTKKTIHRWKATCEVHEKFSVAHIRGVRENYPGIRILVHPESPKEVVDKADFVGSTEGMMTYTKNSKDKKFMYVTECGLMERARVEFPDKEFFGTCLLCPHMQKNTLQSILDVMTSPRKEQVVEVPEGVRVKAKVAVDKMFELMAKAKK